MCDVISLSFVFYVIPIEIFHVFLPGNGQYVLITCIIVTITIAPMMFIMFIVDKWTNHVVLYVIPCTTFTSIIAFITYFFFLSQSVWADIDVVIMIANTIFVAGAFVCGALARMVKQKLYFFWGIEQPLKEKPATYLAMAIVAGFLGISTIDWRSMFLIVGLIVSLLPPCIIMVRRKMQVMKNDGEPIIERYKASFNRTVSPKAAVKYLITKSLLALLFVPYHFAIYSGTLNSAFIGIFFSLSFFSSMPPASVIYLAISFIVGAFLLLILWMLMRKHHHKPWSLDTITVICLATSISELATAQLVLMIPGFAVNVIVMVLVFINHAFLTMSYLFVFLVVFDFFSKKKLDFFENIVSLIPVILYFFIFQWIITLINNTWFFWMGIISTCALLLYFVSNRRLSMKSYKTMNPGEKKAQA
nr:hypothetical protein [Candidatus Sigynarchaeota archaeon]